jgi:hypothetical protein
MLFRTQHRFKNGDITEQIYQRRMLRLQRAEGSRLCVTPRYRNRCALLLKHDVMCWSFLSNQAVPLTDNEVACTSLSLLKPWLIL